MSEWQTWLDAPEWAYEAECLGMPWEWFFLEDLDKHHKNEEKRLKGIEVCWTCPVQDECLKQAIEDNRLDHGIRGGLTTVERRRLRRQTAHLSLTGEQLLRLVSVPPSPLVALESLS